MHLIGALLITYFVSRGVRRIRFFGPGLGRVIAAHVVSLLLVSLFVVALRYPSNVFEVRQLHIYALAQLVWMMLDIFRLEGLVRKPRGG